MTKTVALVPLREGSKSIPFKNIKLMGGKPLCAWVLEAALNASHVDEVYVSTESDKIKSIVRNISREVKIIHRPSELATDEASTESVMRHFMESVDCNRLVTIQATSPLLCSRHIDEALKQFEEHAFDSLFSAVRLKRFFWSDECMPINYDPLKRPRRQDFSGTLMENGALYITKKTIFMTNFCRLGGQIGMYEMPEKYSVELDEPRDWDVVSTLLEGTERV